MSKKSIVPWMLLAISQAVSQAVLAQTAPPAGGQLQQIPPTPPRPTVPPRVELPAAPSATTQPESAPFLARQLSITGARSYSEAELLAVTGFVPGQQITLQALGSMATLITNHYHRGGYLVARAYLPAQEVKDGVVTIAVMEGQYGRVTLNNSTSLQANVAGDALQGLNSGAVIERAPLESRLLQLSDLRGVQVRSTLVPGASVGLSDLIVDVTPGPRINGSIDVDNAGNRYTGAYRAGVTVNLNNPAGMGDVATLRALTSGSGLHYLRGSYQVPVGRGRVGLAYSHLGYELGREFEPLQAHGTAKIATVFGSYSLVRSRNNNLNVGLSLDHKQFRDHVDSLPASTDKRAQVLVGTLYGDHRDTIGGGGINSYSLAWSAGRLDIRTPSLRAADAITARTQGHYNKLAFSFARVQQASDSVSFLASVNGQVASKNLDVSEKMELGGMYGVRAYPEGEAYADQGVLVTLEARKQLPPMSDNMVGQVHLVAFVDSGIVKLHKTPWAPGSNRRHLSGAGVGVIWSQADDFSVRAYYARKVGGGVATSAPDTSGRFWVQAVKYF